MKVNRGQGAALAAVMLLSACNTNPVQQTAYGTAAGAVTPAAAPVQPGCKQLGGGGNTNAQNAAIGAGIGALAGALIGKNSASKTSVGVRNGLLLGALTGALAGSQYNSMIGMTEQNDGSVKLNIPGAVLFRSGSADVNPAFQQTLNQVAGTIKEYCGLTATVIGHTDSVGSYSSNKVLSERRAAAVVSYLQSQAVEGSRLYTEGRASDFPVASNTDESGRSQNRRVEIFVRPPAN